MPERANQEAANGSFFSLRQSPGSRRGSGVLRAEHSAILTAWGGSGARRSKEFLVANRQSSRGSEQRDRGADGLSTAVVPAGPAKLPIRRLLDARCRLTRTVRVLQCGDRPILPSREPALCERRRWKDPRIQRRSGGQAGDAISPARRPRPGNRERAAHALRRAPRREEGGRQRAEPQALGFYLRMGFKVKSRSPLDSLGKPFPILHVEL